MATTPRCPKCGGYLTLETMDDGSHVVRVARCVNCGKMLDQTIVAYQRLQQEGVQFIKRYERKWTARGKYK